MWRYVNERFSFSYESDASINYLVIAVGGGDKVIDYQVQKLMMSPRPDILHMHVKHSDRGLKFYYNITSKIPLHQLLDRRKLKKDEFIYILDSIVKILLDCKRYSLWNKNIIIHEDYIYINPRTFELSMAYLPVEAEGDACQETRVLFKKLIAELVQIDESSTDNFLLRILNNLKSDGFSIEDFKQLLELLKHNPRVPSQNRAGYPIGSTGVKQVENAMAYDPAVEKVASSGSEYSGHTEGAGHTEKNKQQYFIDQQTMGYNTKKGSRAKTIFMVCMSQLLLSAALFSIITFVLTGWSTVEILLLSACVGAADILVLVLFFTLRNNLRHKDYKRADAGRPQNSSMGGSIKPVSDACCHDKRQDSPSALYVKAADAGINGYGVHKYRAAQPGELKAPRPPYTETDVLFGEETEVLAGAGEEYGYLISSGGDMDRRIVINKPRFKIGRMPGQADYVSQNSAVGKVHAEFIFSSGRYLLKDLNSKNGTFINGRRIDSGVEYQIRHNDEIVFADSRYIFRIQR